VIALVAGGPPALSRAVEGAEDDREAGERAVLDARLGPLDLLVGVSASGRTPFVLAALATARERGARTALVACDVGARVVLVDHHVVLETGPEPLVGSTRLKAATATKLVLNAMTTGAMALTGKVHGDLMVEVAPSNEKLLSRARRIVCELAHVEGEEAARLLDLSGGEVKVAVVMGALGLTREGAKARLGKAGGFLRRVLEGRP
jgi:N-acetylmuramic acid 6-phosphate etherase